MEGFLDYKQRPRDYVYAKVYEALVEANLSLEMLRRGLLQNAASKAFLSVKSLISALVVSNFAKLIEKKPEKEKVWYETIGYSAPTTGLIGVAKDLKELGFEVETAVKTALLLHKFSYNGFDPNFVDYRDEREVREDVLEVLEWVVNARKYFKDVWDERLEKEREKLERGIAEEKV
ncbi:MAG: PaREP1 family protein [Thermoprotei archaeon]